MHTSAILPLQYPHPWTASHQSVILVLFAHALLQGVEASEELHLSLS
jgi:hypothetical protein